MQDEMSVCGSEMERRLLRTGIVRGVAGLALATVAAVALAACSSSNSGGGHPLAVTLNSFKVTADQTTVPAGKVTFNVTNLAPIEHEMVVIRTDTPADQLPVDSKGEASEDGKVDEIEEFAGPNKTKKLTLDLKPGKYVLLCNVPTHYGMGMHVALTVE